jgi:hypothetical protein
MRACSRALRTILSGHADVVSCAQARRGIYSPAVSTGRSADWAKRVFLCPVDRCVPTAPWTRRHTAPHDFRDRRAAGSWVRQPAPTVGRSLAAACRQRRTHARVSAGAASRRCGCRPYGGGGRPQRPSGAGEPRVCGHADQRQAALGSPSGPALGHANGAQLRSRPQSAARSQLQSASAEGVCRRSAGRCGCCVAGPVTRKAEYLLFRGFTTALQVSQPPHASSGGSGAAAHG